MGDLEGTEAARYCGSPYVEQGGGDVYSVWRRRRRRFII